jgi:diguanylate cyclase (GGDEF)-like protein
MKLKTKIIAGTSFLFFMLVILSAVLIHNQWKVQVKLKTILSVNYARIQSARNLQEEILQLSRAERNYLLFEEPVYLNRINERLKAIDKTIAHLENIVSPHDELVKELIVVMANYKKSIEEMIRLNNFWFWNRNKAKDLAKNVLRKQADKMDAISDKIIKYNQISVDRSKDEILSILNWNRLVTYILCGLMIFFSFVGLLILWKTNRTFQVLNDGILAIKEKQFGDLPVDSANNSEFNSAIRSFNSMSTWLGGHIYDLNQLANKDGLTGLYNHRYLQEKLDEEFRRFTRSNDPFSLVMVDIDRFKTVNDTYGHESGDVVLKHVAEVLKGNLRKSDWVARYGGEEFLIFLFGADKHAAFQVMEKTRMAVERFEMLLPQHDRTVHVNISCGISSCPFDGAAKDELIQKADSALYRAKANGRNQTVLYEMGQETTGPGLPLTVEK